MAKYFTKNGISLDPEIQRQWSEDLNFAITLQKKPDYGEQARKFFKNPTKPAGPGGSGNVPL